MARDPAANPRSFLPRSEAEPLMLLLLHRCGSEEALRPHAACGKRGYNEGSSSGIALANLVACEAEVSNEATWNRRQHS